MNTQITMSQATSVSNGSERALQRNYNVPVRRNEMSIFDGAFTFMKQRFCEEMRRIDEEMTKFSKNLLNLYQTATYKASIPPEVKESDNDSANLESLTSSPLIEEVGDDKLLRLQFNVSQFEPEEVDVKIYDDLLVVSARHEENSEDSSMYSKYHREFRLPVGIDPETVDSVLSKDGVLTVRAPLNLTIE